jgi:hypothetical protein
MFEGVSVFAIVVVAFVVQPALSRALVGLL